MEKELDDAAEEAEADNADYSVSGRRTANVHGNPAKLKILLWN